MIDPLSVQHKIIVVTVTYGDRWHHLAQVIPAVFQQQIVEALVIVDNASNYDINAKISATFPTHLDDIIVLTQHENTGSAGGFSLGIRKAYALQADFIYIIDDDNLPEDQAVLLLYQTWNQLNCKEPSALLSFRYRNLPNLQKAALGEEIRYFHDKPNSFLGFSLVSLLTKQKRKGTKSIHQSTALLPQVNIQQAPYGGLFLSKGTIEHIGFPNEQLYLYADDTEYTYRIIQQGGEILMITASKLCDLETSWWSDVNALKKKWSVPLLEEGGFKAYYSTRNLTWFLWQNLSPNPVLFFLNGFIYLGFLFVMALVSQKLHAYSIILLAVKDGISGKLGKNPKMEKRA